MTIWLVLSRMLTILAVVSLVAGGASAASASAGPKESAPIVTVADDMSCCDQPPPDCSDMKACPLAVLCIAKCPLSVSMAPSMAIRVALAARHIANLAQLGAGLPASIPDHPPKS